VIRDDVGDRRRLVAARAGGDRRAAARQARRRSPDRAFYEGKRFGALFFAFNVLPGVAAKAQMMRARTAPRSTSIAAFAPA